MENVEKGLQASFANLAEAYRDRFGEDLTEVSAIGVSGMMHGYLAFDEKDNLLVPFRTWRNTNAEQAGDELSALLRFNIPMRWSVSQYYQAVLNKEEHIRDVAFLTTISGYVHYRLTGKKVIGVGDASGMFPVSEKNYDREMIGKFNELLRKHGIEKPFESILPEILVAGECAGTLTEEGARWLDVTGKLKAGCILCPPEGDGDTGMVATNCVIPGTANVSGGTSGFLLGVIEKPLTSYYKELDVIHTPHGIPVVVVHVNNFASEMTAWTNLFEEVIALAGGNVNRDRLFDMLYTKSLEADENCGGLVGYNFLAGEPTVQVASGSPLIVRASGGKLNLANFMKMHIYSALGALSIGREILAKENVKIDNVYGHGGFFKTAFVGQSAMSAALGAPITVMSNAGEGGAWGIAVLALFACLNGDDFESFLTYIFKDAEKTTVAASEDEKRCFENFMKKYKSGLAVERLASEIL